MAKRRPHNPSTEGYQRVLAKTRRERYDLRLYVTDMTPRCVLAFENLTRICEDHLRGRYAIEVVDVLEHPERARADQIVMIPTLMRDGLSPVRKVVGSLSSPEQVLEWLGLGPAVSEAG